MGQMARENELGECCEFMSKLLLAFVFEQKRPVYWMSAEGRGDVSVLVSQEWLKTEDCRMVSVLENGNWESHCFGESKGSDDTWFL